MSKNKPRQAPSCITPEISFSNVRKVHPALRNYLGYCLHKSTSILKTEVKAAFEKYNIQGHHFAILSVIGSSKGEIHQMNLCDETGIDKASMVKIIDHLEKASFIERVGSPHDRRIKNLVITKKGALFLKDARSELRLLEANFLGSLNGSEVETLKKLLLRILDHHQSE